ncbi:hypothetical protein B0H11DRAFT_2261636 [Mycena galericulata]|nr:hypothetical protein B0H11DRAFT_2261636 [Mycena galericulata]
MSLILTCRERCTSNAALYRRRSITYAPTALKLKQCVQPSARTPPPSRGVICFERAVSDFPRPRNGSTNSSRVAQPVTPPISATLKTHLVPPHAPPSRARPHRPAPVVFVITSHLAYRFPLTPALLSSPLSVSFLPPGSSNSPCASPSPLSSPRPSPPRSLNQFQIRRYAPHPLASVLGMHLISSPAFARTSLPPLDFTFSGAISLESHAYANFASD